MRVLIFLIISINLYAVKIPTYCEIQVSEKNCISNYSNWNYSIKLTKKNTIEVKVNLKPLHLKTRYPFTLKDKALKKLIEENIKNSDELLPIAERIEAKSRGYYECVDNVLNFVSLHFEYYPSEISPFRGDCNTAAKTTIKILALCGIPARIRYVIKLEDKSEVIVSGRRLHAIVEIYYPQHGWIFSDPVKYHHFIPSSYVLVNCFNPLLGVRFEKKKCLNKKPITDILKGKTIVYKVPNLFRFF